MVTSTSALPGTTILNLPLATSLDGDEYFPIVQGGTTKRVLTEMVATQNIIFGNPTASVGLTAVNGVAVTAMRSDAAPALSQSISPTWTGLHTFTQAVSMQSTLSVTGNFAINTNKFNVTAATGNTTIAGTVAIGGSALGSAVLTLSSGSQTYCNFFGSGGASGKKAMALAYDPGNVGLTQPGLFWQNISDLGVFVSNSGVLFRDGAAAFGSITYPGSAGSVSVAGTLAVAGVATVTNTTTSTNRTTGALVIGNGASGGLGVGGKVSAANFASFLAPATGPAVDFLNSTTTSVTNGSSYALYTQSGGYLICLHDYNTGQAAVYFAHIATVALITAAGTEWVAPTTTPGAGQCSVAWDGVGSYRVYNNSGSAAAFAVGIILF